MYNMIQGGRGFLHVYIYIYIYICVYIYIYIYTCNTYIRGFHGLYIGSDDRSLVE